MKIKIKNMLGRTGKPVPNQFIIEMPKGRAFQSYDSEIVFISFENGVIYLDQKYWNFSSTTSKYRNKFLKEETKDTEKKIKEGIYKLMDLN